VPATGVAFAAHGGIDPAVIVRHALPEIVLHLPIEAE
jgi:hypothetical protein